MRAVESVQEFTPDTQTVCKALSFSIWDGIFANLYANLTGGVFLVGYALALKTTSLEPVLDSLFCLFDISPSRTAFARAYTRAARAQRLAGSPDHPQRPCLYDDHGVQPELSLLVIRKTTPAGRIRAVRNRAAASAAWGNSSFFPRNASTTENHRGTIEKSFRGRL